jgi:pimeloyl-ACP methyl ester carboxylesterase
LPEGDQRVFASAGVKEMFIEDYILGVHEGGVEAMLQDLFLFTRPWGFNVRDITTTVHWWHGDKDSIIPLRHSQHMAELLPNCTFILQPGDSHLSGYAAADDVIEAAASFFASPRLLSGTNAFSAPRHSLGS